MQNVDHANVERETEISHLPNLFIFFTTLQYYFSVCPVGFRSTRFCLAWQVSLCGTYYLQLSANKKVIFWCCSQSCPPTCLATPWPTTDFITSYRAGSVICLQPISCRTEISRCQIFLYSLLRENQLRSAILHCQLVVITLCNFLFRKR